MPCYNCNVKSYGKLCTNCYRDEDISIFHTAAKKRYKIDDDDLYTADIYKIHGTVHGIPTIKYLVKDVEQLIKTITNCSSDDKRYNAMRLYRDEINNKKSKIESTKNNIILIKNHLNALADKHDSPDIMKHIINTYIDHNIKTCLQEPIYFDDIDGVFNITNVIQSLLPVVENYVCLYIDFNQYIQEKLGCDYDECVKEYDIYRDLCSYYLYNGFYDEHFNNLFIQLENKHREPYRKARAEELDYRIKNSYKKKNKNFTLLAKTYDVYKYYINNGTLNDNNTVTNIDIVVEMIKDKLNLIILYDKRREQLDNLINKYIQKEYCIIAYKSDIYKNFINITNNTNNTNINRVIEQLIDHVAVIIRDKKKQIKID